jgi:hypothetical protein
MGLYSCAVNHGCACIHVLLFFHGNVMLVFSEARGAGDGRVGRPGEDVLGVCVQRVVRPALHCLQGALLQHSAGRHHTGKQHSAGCTVLSVYFGEAPIMFITNVILSYC